jgi:hypothetical protein
MRSEESGQLVSRSQLPGIHMLPLLLECHSRSQYGSSKPGFEGMHSENVGTLEQTQLFRRADGECGVVGKVDGQNNSTVLTRRDSIDHQNG